MEVLPDHIINKILLYNIHPVAELFKTTFLVENQMLSMMQNAKPTFNSFSKIWHVCRNFDYDTVEDTLSDSDSDDELNGFSIPVCKVCVSELHIKNAKYCFMCMLRQVLHEDN